MEKKYTERLDGKFKSRVVTIRITDEKLLGFIEHLLARGVNLSAFTRLVWKDTPDYIEYLKILPP